jgi:hypothetical protein
MAITKLTHHDNHKVSIHRCKPTAVHYAALRCNYCDCHIQWLNRQEAEKIAQLGVDFYDYKSVEEFI